MRPTTTPVAKPAVMPSHIGLPACSTRAVMMPEMPMTEPTDKSMPAVMMTAVMPRAMMPMKAKLRVTLNMLSALANTGDTKLMTMPMMMTANVTQNAWLPISFCNGELARTPTTSSIATWLTGRSPWLRERAHRCRIGDPQACSMAPVIRPVTSSGELSLIGL